MTASSNDWRIGVDVGGTFTDLVAWDGESLRIAKIPSTPPQFQQAVIEAVGRVAQPPSRAAVVHGSTVATNALLQRGGEPVAFVTTEGFRDMLLIGRQNRPQLYALRVQRPRPITDPANCFTVPERIDAHGRVLRALEESDVQRLAEQIRQRGLKHVAVCLLFSFVNPVHEELIARHCEAAGLTVSLSSQVLPEFREYERASTTSINAALRPVVHEYLQALSGGLPATVRQLRIMQSGGGTVEVGEAAAQAARLVLSGPAGGVQGAAFVAHQAGFRDVITYDMGGTSTDVAVILDGRPQWTTRATIDGLPVASAMFDIHTVGAGGGSVAYLDAGGALRVGPRSAGARPGPACYDRGGTEPTVTDANLLLGRILPGRFLGGKMALRMDLARQAISQLARSMGKSEPETALGIVRIAEANMAAAIRAVTAQRGHDPRRFALVSFGGAGGLHACALAEALEIPRVLLPPYCGVLSALGMVVAPPVVDVARTVVQMGRQLDDRALAEQMRLLEELSAGQLPQSQTQAVEHYADVRLAGQSHELKVRLERLTLAELTARFHEAYQRLYGSVPQGRAVEVVTLRCRRVGAAAPLRLPRVEHNGQVEMADVELVNQSGQMVWAKAVDRAAVRAKGPLAGPLLVIDNEATAYIPRGWRATAMENGTVVLER